MLNIRPRKMIKVLERILFDVSLIVIIVLSVLLIAELTVEEGELCVWMGESNGWVCVDEETAKQPIQTKRQ